MQLINLILLTLFGGVFSLVGGVVLLKNKKMAKILSHISAPFAAGALLAAVFFDLLPEALDIDKSTTILFWALTGIIGFFILERRLGWFHHHHEHDKEIGLRKRMPAMLIIGDTVHNAIDGAAIAIAFIADPGLGVVTALAVALHEIPQEIGDFGLLLKAGWKPKDVLKVNVLSALSSVVVAVVVYFVGQGLESFIGPSLGLISGMLLYVALSDVVPTVHETKSGRKWFDNASMLLLAGVAIVYSGITITHGLIHDSHEDNHSSEQDHQE